MSIAPHTGIVDFGTFTAPTVSTDGIQGEVPKPLAGQAGYVLTGNGWASAGSVGLVGYQGTWNASTNTPTLTSSVGVQGYYYVVSVTGTTNLNGITDWQVGDWAIFNGTVWQKVDNTDSYDPANVAITGGTINNTVIGGTTPVAGTFTPLTVYQATTATKATGLNQWNYSGNSISISAQETASTGLFFRDDGTRMFFVGSSSDTVFQYNLGTAWDVTTATYTIGNGLSIAAQDTAASDIFFKPDGLAFYLLGDTNNSVFQYTIGTAWTINTGAYASKSFSVAAQETSPTGLWFRPDGSTMYVVGSASDNINQYSLGTAWDVTTATFVQAFSISAQDGVSASLVFNPTGISFYTTGTNNDNVYQYNLGTAWDISTSVFVPNQFHVGAQESTPTGLFIDFTADNRAYVSGSSTDAVYQYNTATTSVSFASDRFNWNGNTNITGNSYFNGALTVTGTVTAYGSATILGTLTASGALSATSTITLSGSTTSTTGLGTSATTGTTTIGGTAQTGAITIGQSTAAQTLNLNTGSPASAVTQVTNIATGAGTTTTASTKTINIGTGGITGTNTNINIGSSTSGSLGTIAIQSPTVNIGQTATQFAVTNTASAVNYVQVTGAATGGIPAITVQGSDTNIRMNISSKGTESVDILTNNTGTRAAKFTYTASSVNWVQMTGAAAGASPSYAVAGSDTNIDLTLTPKGTGNVRFGTYTANMALTIQGYVEIKDSGGTVRRLAVIA